MKHTTPSDVPQFFRLNIEVGDLAAAISFYTRLLGIQGRKQAGSRCYFNCGSVTLQVLDVSSVREPHPAAKALYFTVSDLDAAYERAGALKCVSRQDVHDAPAAVSLCVPGAAGLWLHRLSGGRDRGAHQSQAPEFSKVFVKSA